MGYLVLSVIFLCAVNVAGQIGPEICTPECLNGGICNESTCLCPGGYKGEYCQIPPSADSTTAKTPTVDVTTNEPPTTPMVPTPPPPPPPTPSIFPGTTLPTAGPNTTTTFATPTKLPTPFTTIRIPVTSTKKPEPGPTKMIPTPPPPPPPSPSLFITPPESSTHKPSLEPTTRPSTMRSVARTGTMTPHPTTSRVVPTKKIDPVLIENGGVTITLEFPPTEFDNEEQMKFKTTIANNVNDFCSSGPENCDITGLHVGSNDVIMYETRGITEPEMAAILEMEGTDTVVSFYVTHPSSSSILVLNAEQLETMLTENSDKISEELGYGFQRGALDEIPEPLTSTTLEPWIIAIICVVGAAVVCIAVIVVGLYIHTRSSGDKDLEIQESYKMNGDAPKEARITTSISTQASQSDIILETKHVFINHYGTDPVGGVDEVDGKVNLSTQVTYQDILTATCLNEDGLSYNHDSDTNNTAAPNSITIASVEPDANVVCTEADVESLETNEIPPSYDDAMFKSTFTSPEDLPPPPPDFLEGNSVRADGAAVRPSDNLVMKNIGEKTDNAFDNPAYVADTEIDETGELFTAL